MSNTHRTNGSAIGTGTGALSAVALLVFAMFGAGCATLMPRDVVPERLADEAELTGMPDVRVWGDASAESLAALVRAGRPRMGVEARRPELNIIAISGGGDNGAFGAGLLVGWSDAGTRPDFDLVTGVSAGALTAPFVYLGRSRNAELKEVFTRYTRNDIYDPGIVTPLLGSGLVDSSPLENLIATYVDERFLQEVARERRTGSLTPASERLWLTTHAKGEIPARSRPAARRAASWTGVASGRVTISTRV